MLRLASGIGNHISAPHKSIFAAAHRRLRLLGIGQSDVLLLGESRGSLSMTVERVASVQEIGS